jgi:DNA-binding CsgD family transcriptional regulator
LPGQTIMREQTERQARVEAAIIERDLSAKAFQFAEAVQNCDDMQALSEATQAAIRSVGMTAVASGLVSEPRIAQGHIFHFVNWPVGWLELYEAEGYGNKDPVPRWALMSGMPISWTELKKQLAPNDLGHEVYANASKWGFTEGFVTPARGLDGSIGLVSIGGNRDSLRPHEQLFLQCISVAAFLRAEQIAGFFKLLTDPAPLSLGAREALGGRRANNCNSEDHLRTQLRTIFGLTMAECRVAVSLYQGDSLQGVAAKNGKSWNTLRVQLTKIFEKTGTHRQAELIAVIRRAIDAAVSHEHRTL